ncbi:MAG: CbiX/SirB N-terminal domain-containing protein [Candidatus Hydrogenedentota bacterium]
MNENKAIIILAHGSRNSQAKEEFLKLVNSVSEKLPSYRIEPAFFQFSKYNLPNVLSKLAQEGYKKIRIIPAFLFQGMHINKDIPEAISKIKENLPDLEISLSITLWPDERISEIIVERIIEEPGC